MINHVDYQQRLALVEDILQRFNLRTEISPIDYDENCPFPYNNFLYKVTLESSPSTNVSSGVKQSFTSGIEGTEAKELVVRICNPKAEGLSQRNRVPNEVYAIALARAGLEAHYPNGVGLVPNVYGWKVADAAKAEAGWVLMDHKSGVPLDKHFETLDREGKAFVLEQLADVFAAIQKAPVPKHLTQLSGINFDTLGNPIAGDMTTVEGGPWSSYVDFWRSRLTARLEGADESSVIGGWKKNDTRQRIDKFLLTGLDQVIGPSEGLARVLVHGDFTMNNILVDPHTNTLTGLVDFDFASISHPAEEFFMSLGDVGGNTGGWQGPDLHAGRLEAAVIAGDFSSSVDAMTTALSEEAQNEWFIAKTWDAALRKRDGVLRPSDILGMRLLARLPELAGLLCPSRLVNPRVVARQTATDLEESRAAAEESLRECLTVLGY